MFLCHLTGDFENINIIATSPEKGNLFKVKYDICGVHLVNPSYVEQESIHENDNYFSFI
jgi:hypothetical protein